jgi:type IV secretion system protein VirB8
MRRQTNARVGDRMASQTNDLKVTKKDEAEYFKEAASWDEDRVRDLVRSRRNARLVAGGVMAVAALQAIALVSLIPLKSVEPFLVRVDNSTGIVDQVTKLKDAKITYDEAMTKFFLRRVVTLRETYTRAQLESNYDHSVLFTAPAARPQLKAAFSFENPNGPYKRYGELGTASIQIVTVSFVAKNVAQVRYIKTERKGGAETQSRWVATIEFIYVAQPASEEARGVNPLGFQVTNYRNDPEAIVEGAN